MTLVRHVYGTLLILIIVAALLALPTSAFSQERVGVVTNLEGTVTVARVTLPQAQSLRFKDDVYLRDRITTGERAIVRVLLGGKATVTARERSVLTITEVPGTSTIELGAGRISVAVSKGLMKPGEVVEIKTPNAVTAIRGTVVVAEVAPAGEGHRSTITILRGLVEVTRFDATAGLVGPAVKVGALQRVAVTGSGPVSPPETITQEAARRLASDFSLVPKDIPTASREPLNAALKEAATREAVQLTGSTTDSVTTMGSVTTTTGSVTTTGTSSLSDATRVLTTTTSSVTAVTGKVAPTATGVTTTSPSLITPVLDTVTKTTSTVTNGLLSGLGK